MQTQRHMAIFGAGAIVLLVLAVYSPALRAGFIWDDDDYVTNNPALVMPDGLAVIWWRPWGIVPQYYPLVFTSFRLEHALWGLHPFGYHLINVLLQAFSAVLLWRLLRRLRVPGAWLAGAIFAVHPVCVESAAWITERKNMLSMFFYLLAMHAYLRFADADKPEEGEALPRTDAGRVWRWYAAALVLFICALLSKTVTCSLPAAIVLIFWWRRGRIAWRAAAPLAPFFIAGLAAARLTSWMETHNVGAQGSEWSLSLADRCLIAGRAAWFYAGKLLWPHHLAFFYRRWQIDSGVLWQYAFPAAAVGLLVVLWALRKRIGRGPLAAALLFGGTLAPALGFIDVYPMRYSFVADHFQYLAMPALIALIVAGVVRFALRLGETRHRAAQIAAGVIVLALASAAWDQAHAFHSLDSLWRDTLRKTPTCWAAHTNFASVLIGQKRPAEAVIHCNITLAREPDDARALNNRACAYRLLHNYDAALADYGRALKSAEQPAVKATIYRNRALVELDMERFAAVVADCTRAIGLAPGFPDPYYNRALARYALHEYAKAWSDVQAFQQLGGTPHPGFIETLQKALGEK